VTCHASLCNVGGAALISANHAPFSSAQPRSAPVPHGLALGTLPLHCKRLGSGGDAAELARVDMHLEWGN